MDVAKILATINGNYVAVFLFVVTSLIAMVSTISKKRKDWKLLLSVINNCDNKIILNQFQDAIEEYEEILKKPNLNKYNKGFVLYQIGYVHHKMSLTENKEKNIKKGLYNYYNAINLFPEYNSFRWKILSKEKKKLIGYAMNGLGHIQNDMAMIREPEKFTKASLEALSIAEKINKKYDQRYQLAITYSNFAVSYRKKYDINKELYDFNKALKYNKFSLNLLNIEKNKSDIARVENNLGNLFAQKAVIEDDQASIFIAIKHLEKSKEHYSLQDSPYEHARSCMNIGAAYIYKSKISSLMEDINIGIDNLEISINIFEKLGSKMEQATAYLNVIKLYQLKYIQSEKIKYLKKAYKYSCKIVEDLNVISNPVLSQQGILEKVIISFSLYSITNDEKYFDSGIDAYRLFNSEKENSIEETKRIQLMLMVAKMYMIHASLTKDLDSLEVSKYMYKQIYDNKKSTNKDKFISWTKYTEILGLNEEYDQGISAVELSIDLAKMYFPEKSINDEVDEVDIENISLIYSEEIEQLYNIRDLTFIISANTGNHKWREDIDKMLHEIFASLYGMEKIILGVDPDEISELLGINIEN